MIKYPSMIGESHDSDLKELLLLEPKLKDLKWVALEKIDGSNFSVRISHEGLQLFSRTQEITNTDFNCLHRLLLPILFEPWCTELIDNAFCQEKEVILFGEVFGAGINKRVFYGKEKYIRFFDILIIDEDLEEPTEEFMTYVNFTRVVPSHRRVPEIANNLSYEDAVNFTFNKNSLLTPTEYQNTNLSEGAALRPMTSTDKLGSKLRPMLKRRNAEFLEGSLKVIKDELTDTDRFIELLNSKFKDLINENRVVNLLSKHPELITNNKLDIQKSIPLMLKDAKTDFHKEVDPQTLENLNESQLRSVFNVGSVLFHLLRSFDVNG